jgi:hypothetical protein
MQGKDQFSIAVREDFFGLELVVLPGRRHAHGMNGKITKTFYFSWQKNRKLAYKQLDVIDFLFSCSLRL